MSFLTQPIEAWTAADVERLIDERVEESQRLDYKQELKLNTKTERRATLPAWPTRAEVF